MTPQATIIVWTTVGAVLIFVTEAALMWFAFFVVLPQ